MPMPKASAAPSCDPCAGVRRGAGRAMAQRRRFRGARGAIKIAPPALRPIARTRVPRSRIATRTPPTSTMVSCARCPRRPIEAATPRGGGGTPAPRPRDVIGVRRVADAERSRAARRSASAGLFSTARRARCRRHSTGHAAQLPSIVATRIAKPSRGRAVARATRRARIRPAPASRRPAGTRGGRRRGRRVATCAAAALAQYGIRLRGSRRAAWRSITTFTRFGSSSGRDRRGGPRSTSHGGIATSASIAASNHRPSISGSSPWMLTTISSSTRRRLRRCGRAVGCGGGHRDSRRKLRRRRRSVRLVRRSRAEALCLRAPSHTRPPAAAGDLGERLARERAPPQAPRDDATARMGGTIAAGLGRGPVSSGTLARVC